MSRTERGFPLRGRLLLLAAVGVLPLALMAGIALAALVQQQREQLERGALSLTRALATAVDGELRRSISALETLASSDSLRGGDLTAFYRETGRVVGRRGDWLSATLVDPSGRMLFNTDRPLGTTDLKLAERKSFELAASSGRPVVGYVARGPLGRFAVPVRVPVTYGGELRYVLSAAVEPEAFVAVLNRQRVPDDWVLSVFDANGTRVARSRLHAKYLGTPAAPSLAELMAGGAGEGTGATHTLEGDLVYTAYTRLADSGWSVAVGIPAASAEMAAYRSLAVYGSGILLSLALAVLAALVIARSINRPIGELRKAAQALGRGEPAEPPATGIPELQEVADALRASAAQRERLHADAESARSQAESANRSKDEFLAMLGHELRNPLAPIVAALQLMERRGDSASLRERRIIERQVEHLSRLVDDLLDVSRITEGKIRLEREPVELKSVVARALELIQPALEGRSRPIELELPDEPLVVSGDPLRLTQVVCNLLSNAAKFTRPSQRIKLALRRDGANAEIRVRDEGRGIPAELLPRVFDLFTQSQQAIDRRAGGLGLGLAIVKMLVSLHGGEVHASSGGTDRGSEFVVRLPTVESLPVSHAAHPAAPARAAVDCAQRDVGNNAQSGARILIVDDNHDAAETLSHLLKLVGGFETRAAFDGIAAVAATEHFTPDLALLDIGLPGMDGYALARRLRELLPQLPLVAITGYGREPDRRLSQAAGFDAHLVKPVDTDLLLETIARLLKAPRAQRAAGARP